MLIRHCTTVPRVTEPGSTILSAGAHWCSLKIGGFPSSLSCSVLGVKLCPHGTAKAKENVLSPCIAVVCRKTLTLLGGR